MKLIPKILLIVLVLNIACQNAQNRSKEKTGSGESHITSTEYQTTSGRKFIVHVDHSSGASICTVEVETKGFDSVNTTHKLGTIDPVKEVFFADLDKNGYEEIYLVTQSAGSGSYGNIYGIASNKDKSATPVYVRPVSEKQKEKGGLFEGFQGHNSFFVEDEELVNSFPVYAESDSNSKPSGGKRKIKYRLIAGEAGWILEPIKIIEE